MLPDERSTVQAMLTSQPPFRPTAVLSTDLSERQERKMQGNGVLVQRELEHSLFERLGIICLAIRLAS